MTPTSPSLKAQESELRLPISIDGEGCMVDADGRQIAAVLPNVMREVGAKIVDIVNASRRSLPLGQEIPEAAIEAAQQAMLALNNSFLVNPKYVRAALKAALPFLSLPLSGEQEEPVAYLHTLHMELEQSQLRLSFGGEGDQVFGLPGKDYSPEYTVTIQPLYLRPAQSPTEVVVVLTAAESGRLEAINKDRARQGFKHITPETFYEQERGVPIRPAQSQEGVATHRHKKRGSEYVLIGVGKMQAETWVTRPGRDVGLPEHGVDMREVAIYRSIDDGSLWVRPREEFEDGRFEAISSLNTQEPK